MVRERPKGVVIIAVLEFLLGAIVVLGSLGMFILAGLTTNEEFHNYISQQLPQWAIDNAVLVFGSLGTVMLVIGVVNLLLGYGFWNAKPWAWTLGVIFAIITIISAFINPLIYGFDNPSWIVTLLVSLVFPWAILYYLNRPNVKTYFGKDVVPVD
jgi:hypothetical protein